MKILMVTLSLIAITATAFAEDKTLEAQHNSIYTAKIKRIVNALNIGEFETDSQYFKMLDTACKRNACKPLEVSTIRSVGQQIVNCQINHLKSHGIENSDASNLCQSKQAIFGCDSLAKPLLRKMCYTGNKYSLKVLADKERKMKSRLPASAK